MTARSDPDAPSRDPLGWCWLIAAAFFALVLHRLALPSKEYFDEIHYLPAARNWLALSEARNTEHPPFAKELMAVALHFAGDRPFGWRIGSAVAGTAALFAAMRAAWWASLSRPATLFAGVLLATNFLTFVIARIAMLDAYMFGFAMIALWLCARAARQPRQARPTLGLAGLAMGLALASKWSVAPLLALPGLAFLGVRWRALEGRRAKLLTATDAPPVARLSLLEAAVWLGALPIAVYLLTFIPLGWFASGAIPFGDVIALQSRMVELQESVVKTHPYQSQWWQWVANLRPIWFLYEEVDGAQRGVLLLGNPFTMLAGLPALIACGLWGWRRSDPAMLGAALLYIVSLGAWIVANKPIQFYYHYLLPGTFLTLALALISGALWQGGRRWPGLLATLVAVGLFAWFYPILSSARLPGNQAFLTYTWLDSWR